MRYKKIMMLAILLVSLLAVSAVSAADNATSDIVSVENQEDNVITDSNNNITPDFDDIVITTPKTFTDLNTLINGNDSDVYLDSNYTFELGTDSDFTDGITIARAVTVHGNGYTIDGDNAARIFTVSNSNIVFRDVVFLNGYSEEGGAICGDCYAVNCTFKDNHADNDGGAILGDCYAVNCTFKDNHAGWGGAISYGSALNCIFIGNSAWVGGAMYGGSSSAVNCTFVNNSVDRDGGAIAYGSAVNCTFVGNSANYGGAICAYRDECAVNCTFINNTARYGGGIYFTDDDCTLINLVFEGNSAQQGVDFYNDGFINLVNVTVDKMSTAIVAPDLTMLYGNSSKLIITLRNLNNNNFVANSQIYVLLNNNEYAVTTDSKGQASLDMPTNLAVGEYEATISYKGNSNYYSASTTCWVSVDKMQTHISAIHNAENMELSATLTTIEGKTIGGANVIINLNGKEYTLKTDSKGQVKISTSDLKSGRHTANITYKGNSKYLQFNMLINIYVNDDVSVGTFIDLANEINNAGSQLKLTGDYAYDPSCDSYYQNGVTIEKSIVIDGNGYTINGNNQARAFSVDAYDVILNNINFVNCSVGNSPEEFGGAIYWDGDNGALSGCSFVNCSVYSSSYDAFSHSYGGAVFWSGANGSLSECIFENCYSSAISISSSFYYYSSYSYGGAVYWDGYEGSLLNCDFVNCYSFSSYKTTSSTQGSYGYGGAVSWIRGAGTLMNCNFVNCTSNRDGGAVFWTAYDGYLSNCSFVDCSCEYDGGAVCWDGEDGILNYCNFIDCQAYNSIYVNCGSGGAVCWSGDNGILSASTFIDCHSTNYGGGIYFIGSDCSLISASFEGCTAKNGSDWYSEKPVIVTDKTLTVLSAPDVIISYGTSKNLIATLKNIDNNLLSGEKISIALNKIDYTLTTNSKGEVSLAIPSNLAPKTYVATITYAGNEIYESSSTTANIIVNKASPVLTMDDVVAVHNTSSAIAVATLKDAYGNIVSDVKIKIVVGSLSKIARTDANGQVSLDISGLEPGEYKIAARSGVTDFYNEAKTTAHAVIYSNKLDTTLTIPDVVVVGNATGAVVVATLKDVYGNIINGVKVKIVVGTLSKIARTDANGQVTMDISSLAPGEYKISARSAVTDIYNEAKATAKAIISEEKLDTTLTIPDVVVVGNATGAVVVATLKDEYGNVISGVKVKIVVGTLSKIARTDVNGQVSFDISSLEIGEYKISARSGVTDIYNEAKTTAKAIISEEKLDTTLTIPDVVVVGNSTGSVVATLKDVYGNVISGVKVKIVAGTLSKIARTDANGQVTMDISSLAPGEYKISARSGITDIYNEAKATATATVTKITPELTIPNVVTIYNTEGSVVATLKDAAGNAISDLKVKIVVGSLSKIARTDANGQVSLDISSLAPGEYRISARTAVTDIYNEAKTTATAIVSEDKIDTTLTIPDVEIQQGNGTAVATLKDAVGNVVSGVKVKIVVGDLSKIARTDADGQVSLDISSLAAGEYKISARSAVTDIYNEAKASAKAIIYAS